MRTTFAIALVWLASQLGATQAKYSLSISGQSVGTGTLTYTKLSNGDYRLVVDLSLAIQGNSLRLQDEEVVDKSARPISSSVVQEAGGHKVERKIAFGPKALVRTDSVDGNAPQKKTVAYPKGKSIAQPSDLWFVTNKPAVGAVSMETQYDSESGSWQNHKNVFVGPTTITIGNKKVKANLIQDKNLADGRLVRDWRDQHGIPFRMELPIPNGILQLDRVMN